MLPRCPDRLHLSRLLYCCFPPSHLLCNKPAVGDCYVFMNAPPPIGKLIFKTSPSFSTISHSWLLDRWFVLLASVPSTTIWLPKRPIIGPHRSRRGGDQHHSPFDRPTLCIIFSYSIRLIVRSFGSVPALPPPPSATSSPVASVADLP